MKQRLFFLFIGLFGSKYLLAQTMLPDTFNVKNDSVFLRLTPQETADEINARKKVGIRARYVTTPTRKIMLHWAPMDSIQFAKGKAFGYKITKYEIEGTTAKLVGSPIIVEKRPKSEWTQKKDLDYYDMLYNALMEPADSVAIGFDFAMFAGSVSYGAATLAGLAYEDAAVDANKTYKYIIVARSSLSDNGASSARQAADIPIIVEGIGSVNINTVQQGFYTIDGQANSEKILKPPHIKLDKSDTRRVEARWKYKYTITPVKDELSRYFAAFYLERKSNLETEYNRVNQFPIVKFTQLSDSLFYVDSIPNKKLTYSYRLVGITYFDEEVLSDPIQVTSFQVYSKVPSIKYFRSHSASQFKLDWQYLNVLTGQEATFPADSIKKYYVKIANEDKPDSYHTIDSSLTVSSLSGLIDRSKIRAPIDSTKSLYIKLIVKTIDDELIESFSYLLMAKSKPGPAQPNLLNAVETSIDTTDLDRDGIPDAQDPDDDGDGKPDNMETPPFHRDTDNDGVPNEKGHYVKISWDKLIVAGDTLKYQLFRSFGNEPNKYDISGGIKAIDSVIDTLAGNMNYPIITYTLIAYDGNFNPSEPRSITYQKKDTFPPFAPIIKSYSVDNLEITLNFELSNDTDIKAFYVIRSNLDGSDKRQIATFGQVDRKLSLVDNAQIENGTTYVYTIYAEDFSGNKSCFDASKNDCFQLVPIKVVSLKKGPVVGFSANLNIDYPSIALTWVGLDNNDITSYELFKSLTDRGNTTNDSKLSFWKTLTANEIYLNDFDINFFATYQYGIRAVYKDGTMSPMSSLSVYLPNKDACVSGKLVIVNETLIPTGTNKADEACFEIKLKPGFQFKANENGTVKYEYSGKIKEN